MNQFKRRIMCEMPAERSLDLDTELDWLVAELIMNRQSKIIPSLPQQA